MHKVYTQKKGGKKPPYHIVVTLDYSTVPALAKNVNALVQNGAPATKPLHLTKGGVGEGM